MSAALKVAMYELRNVASSRWLIGYALFFLLATDALLRFGGGERALLSLVSVVLFVVPLVALVLGATYLYGAREFTELLLAQPVGRGALYAGLFTGLTLPLATAFALGVGLPFLWHAPGDGAAAAILALLATGIGLTLCFAALAYLVALRTPDKARGLGIAVALWLTFALLYDGLVLLAVALFADYSIEQPLLALMLANPVDLARVLLLMRFDAGAIQGYTGAVFARFFGGGGIAIAAAALLLWIAVPTALGLSAFRRRDY